MVCGRVECVLQWTIQGLIPSDQPGTTDTEPQTQSTAFSTTAYAEGDSEVPYKCIETDSAMQAEQKWSVQL